MQKSKPLALVHDPVRGGAPLEFIRDEECPDDELRRGVFVNQATGEPHDVIVWHRTSSWCAASPRPIACTASIASVGAARPWRGDPLMTALMCIHDGSWRLLDRRASFGRRASS